MADTPDRRSPFFDYAASVDPAMSAFGWRYIVLGYLAVLVPLAGILLPRDSATEWGIVEAVLAVAAGTIALNTVYLRRMFSTDGWSEPPAVVVMVQAVAVTIATGGINYALSGRGGFYRPIILIPTILVAVIGNRAMLAATASTALVSLTVSTWAQGIEVEQLPALVLSYGATWGVMVLMIRQLSNNALQATAHTQGLADAAAIAARTEGLDDGLQRLLPVVGAWAVADRVTAYALTDGHASLFDHWPVGTEPCPPPSAAVMERATAEGGAAVDGACAVILSDRSAHDARRVGAPAFEPMVVAVVVDGTPRNRFDAVTYHYQLRRMAEQIRTLVSRSQHIEHLESLGRTDGLTGLPNRRALEERLDLERSVTRHRHDPLTLVMIDLDDFKVYNDTYGHPAGDDLLCRFAEALRVSVRAADFVARYGGEEFCVLLRGANAHAAGQLTDELRALLHADVPGDKPGFSAGVATWNGSESNHQLLQRADQALYAAKASGKGRTIIA